MRHAGRCPAMFFSWIAEKMQKVSSGFCQKLLFLVTFCAKLCLANEKYVMKIHKNDEEEKMKLGIDGE